MKQKTTAQLKKKLDSLWSEWIRRKDAKDGIATCVTCRNSKPWKEMQCGHFVSRVHLATRWMEQNTAVQCGACNVLKRGNMVEYAVWMNENWGWLTVEELVRLKHTTVKHTRADYLRMIADVEEKLKGLDS